MGALCRGKSRTLENIQANTAELVDVGMENFGQESDLRRGHRIVIGEEELELENAT